MFYTSLTKQGTKPRGRQGRNTCIGRYCTFILNHSKSGPSDQIICNRTLKVPLITVRVWPICVFDYVSVGTTKRHVPFREIQEANGFFSERNVILQGLAYLGVINNVRNSSIWQAQYVFIWLVLWGETCLDTIQCLI